MTFIQTYRNVKFDLLTCTVKDIHIIDIAHALSLVNRFGGHTQEPLSVAQHSVMCAILAPRYGVDPMSMLLHDAAEAYVGDIPRYIKKHLGKPYAELEDSVARTIAIKYNTIWPLTEAMKMLDNDLLETEFRDLKGDRCEGIPKAGRAMKDVFIDSWRWTKAKDRFLSLFYELGGRDG